MMSQEVMKRLDAIEVEIHQLRRRLDRLAAICAVRTNQQIATNDLIRLLNTLRKTMMAVIQLKEASAGTVANRTTRTRGIESLLLNQLTRMDYLIKTKRGRKVYFRLAS